MFKVTVVGFVMHIIHIFNVIQDWVPQEEVRKELT